jgi:hypothetical protein
MARVTRASVALKCASSSAAISHTSGALAEYERADGREPLSPGQRPNVERVSLGELIHQCVRGAIETAVHEELRATLGVQPYESHKARRGLSQRDEDAYTHWPDRPPGTHGAARHAVQRAGVDLGATAAVPAAAARGERSNRRHVPRPHRRQGRERSGPRRRRRPGRRPQAATRPGPLQRRIVRGVEGVPLRVVLLFSLVASGQIKLRRIDGWQKIAAVLSQSTVVAA